MSKLLLILRKSFQDARGNYDGKLLTLAGFSGLAMLQLPIGWIWQRWMPEYIWSPLLLFLAAGFGIDAYVTRAKIKAEAGPALVEQADTVNVTTQPDLPPSTP